MEASKNLRDIETIQLCDSITAIDSCLDYIAAGCLDDTVYIWYCCSDAGTRMSRRLATSCTNGLETQWA